MFNCKWLTNSNFNIFLKRITIVYLSTKLKNENLIMSLIKTNIH